MADHLDANNGSGADVTAATSHGHVINMPRLDGSRRSAIAAVATDHSNAIDMTRGRRSAADDKSHVHIDIDIHPGGRGSTSSASDDTPCCVVCTEPLEWVAVGPCGHRVVCSMCAARVRAGPDTDRKCCVCRTLCSSVVVTKAATAADTVYTFPKTVPAVTSRDRRAGQFWYYAAISAYFDDKNHYIATKRAVHYLLKTQRPAPPSSPSPPCPDGVTRSSDASPHYQACMVQYLFLFLSALYSVADAMADHLDTNNGSGADIAAATSHSHVIDMPRLDGSSCSAIAAVTTDHSNAIDMTRGRRSHYNGSTSSASDDIPCCVVCTEPLEWVVVGPCGHRVICSMCAARVHAGPDTDRKCCICRTLCSTVVVTKAATATHSLFTFAESSMPVAAQDDGRVGVYWYSAAMSVYFDDKNHYEATKQAVHCLLKTQRPAPPSSPSPPCPDDVTGSLDAPPHRQGCMLEFFVIFAVVSYFVLAYVLVFR
uniref:RING-type domain-containing protein n=1 Tax=Oryza punctata TaxID=4537 RepID=A0A0E0JK93_ORYPU